MEDRVVNRADGTFFPEPRIPNCAGWRETGRVAQTTDPVPRPYLTVTLSVETSSPTRKRAK